MLKRPAPAIWLCLLLWPAWSWSADAVVLVVQPQPEGGIKATASMVFPVEPAVIQRILIDYRHWPDLFEIRLRIADSREENGSAFTDIRIIHPLLPGERRLMCETRPIAGGGLLTELKGGDFKQYRRLWKLGPAEDGRHTKADFELMVQIETILPDWMIAIATRQELEAHFRKVREKAVAVTTGGK
jgi:hypothetical protein